MEKLGLRERKRQQRRQAIEAAAIDLFEANGFDATTIDDIARAADIAPRTFFTYFPTKEDVVLADYAARLGRIVAELEQRPETEPAWAALQAAFAAVAADYQTERDQLIRRFTLMATTPSVFARSLQLQAGWEDTLADTLTQRTKAEPDEPTPRLQAAAALAAMRASLQHWLRTGHTGDLPTIVSQAFTHLGRGLE
ncbi:MAG: TetR family transcriptional regulator [Acidimicrobiales bacterium]|nr:TetR family transcriptional regulator [Acidimicrobiales bacterium]